MFQTKHAAFAIENANSPTYELFSSYFNHISGNYKHRQQGYRNEYFTAVEQLFSLDCIKETTLQFYIFAEIKPEKNNVR